MMQWIPLAQGKNVAPHLDLAFAEIQTKTAGIRNGLQETKTFPSQKELLLEVR